MTEPKVLEDVNFFRQHGAKIGIASVLAFTSGIVDIIGYHGVFHYFTAHLTGTTVQLGHSLISRNTKDIAAAGVILSAFFLGSLIGRALIELGSRTQLRRIASITLMIEAVLLAVVAGWFTEGGTPYWGLAALAGSMGIQTATMTGIGPLTVHTTFVTGMVNKLAQLVSRISFRSFDFWKTKSRTAVQQRNQSKEIQLASFIFGVWICHAGGAVLGTWSFGFWGLRALFIAVGLLGVSLLTDQIRPLSVREEKEQSES
ncbi:MAG: YoaK family protein [Candidatus Acidiferrum sp.]